MRSLLLILCATLFVAPSSLAEGNDPAATADAANGGWNRVPVTTGSGWIQEIEIGHGRNDATNRLYIANAGGRSVDEYSWDGAEWQRVEIDSPDETPRDACLGEGWNDDLVRVYATDETETLREFTWSGSGWDETVVSASLTYGLTVGRARGDDVPRIYAASEIWGSGVVHEFTRETASWNKESINVGSESSVALELGVGRNDGITRLYAANFDGHIYEVSWEGAWVVTDVGAGAGGMNDVAIGAGRSDDPGTHRVYGANVNGDMYEFTWSGGSWTNTGVMTPTGSTYLREIVVGDGRDDGVGRVYCAGTGSGVVELSWAGSAWAESYIGDELDGLAIGDGRNDGIVRLYAGTGEYTYTLTSLEPTTWGAVKASFR